MRALAPLGSAVLLVLATAVAVAAPPPTVESLSKRYLDGLFRAKPHLATFMGEHAYDGKLPDYSARATAAREKELVALQKLVARVATPTVDAQTDKQILGDGIALELLYLREIRDWEWDARLHDSFPYYDPREVIASRLSDMIHGDYAPEAARRKRVVEQLAAMPAFLASKEKALATGKRHPAKVMLEQAIKANKGRIEFFDTELKTFFANDKRGEAVRKRAVAALQKHQTFLETKLDKRADGDWRLGAELYGKKFPLALQTTLTTDQLATRAEVAFTDARRQLYQVARTLHRQLWPREPMPPAAASNEVQKKTIERVKAELTKDHPTADDLVASHARNLDNLRAFIEKKDLLALPPKETLAVEPMPLFKRGAAGAEYLAPGVLLNTPTWKATYYVDPVDPTWPADKVESYLRANNNYEVQLTAAHEAYPGHHTQYSYAKKHVVPLRAVLWNAPMVEGWAVYGTSLMVALGWGDKANDRFRFFDLRMKMIVATNTIIDIKLQSGLLSDEEAVKLMVQEGFQEQALAEKKLLRAKLDSTQLCQYYLGLAEIEDLERDYKKQVGKAFKQRAFDEGLIGHGSIALKFLRTYMLDSATPAAPSTPLK